MKTKWIIQKNIFTEDVENIIKALKELELPYELIDVIPFSETLPDIPHYDGPVVAYGSTTLMRLADKNWIWYDDNTFKPSHWGQLLGYHYMNHGAKIMPLRDVLDNRKHNWTHGERFIRPNSDFKLFSGAIFRNGDFKDWYDRVKSLIESGTYVTLTLDTSVSVAEIVYIRAEYRFFIADRRIVGASQYIKNGKLDRSVDIDWNACLLAHDTANRGWQLAPAYVVDIADTAEGYKIIEFNNFNSSGFYECNIKDIILGASNLALKEWNNNQTLCPIKCPIRGKL